MHYKQILKLSRSTNQRNKALRYCFYIAAFNIIKIFLVFSLVLAKFLNHLNELLNNRNENLMLNFNSNSTTFQMTQLSSNNSNKGFETTQSRSNGFVLIETICFHLFVNPRFRKHFFLIVFKCKI